MRFNKGLIKRPLFWSVMFVLWNFTAFLVACGRSGSDAQASDELGYAVGIVLGRNQVPLFDSLVVRVGGPNMDERRYIYTGSIPELLALDSIPPGEDRIFNLQVYAGGGVLVQSGEATATVAAGSELRIPIVLKALKGFLQVSVKLGLANTLGVCAGTMQMQGASQDLRFPMTVSQGVGLFQSIPVELDSTWQVSVTLWDCGNSQLFQGSRVIVLSSLNNNAVFELGDARSQVILEATFATLSPVQVPALLSASRTRAPQSQGEAFFTEIMANPKTSGDDYEYLELYNATLDTLDMGGCAIARSRSTTGTTTNLPLPAGMKLPPMEYLVVGRDSVPVAEWHYNSFVLTNSAQSLVLHCNGLLLDSLYYTMATDTLNPFPNVVAHSMQLPISAWQNRQNGHSWCAGQDSIIFGNLWLKGSPGWAAQCP